MTKKRLAWRCNNLQQQRDKAIIYNSKEWKQLRAEKLRSQPLCEMCIKKGIEAGVPGGYIRSAHCVHHIVPIETATTLEDMRRLAINCELSDLMSLCDQCHAEIHKQEHSHAKATVQQREASRHERWKNRMIERFTNKKDENNGTGTMETD